MNIKHLAFGLLTIGLISCNSTPKEKNKERLQSIASSKLDEFAQQTYNHEDSTTIKNIYNKYNLSLDEDINSILLKKAEKLEIKNYREAFFILGIVLIFLLLWIFVFRYNTL